MFKDMVAYTDKIVGKIHDKLVETGLDNNTLLIFTGDNGTNVKIVSYTREDTVKGGKGNTIDAGTRVPLVIHWPAKIKEPRVYSGLIEFSDFYPTLAELTGTIVHSDGQISLTCWPITDHLTGKRLSFITIRAAVIFHKRFAAIIFSLKIFNPWPGMSPHLFSRSHHPVFARQPSRALRFS